MKPIAPRRFAIALMLAAGLLTAGVTAQAPLRRDADQLKQKLAAINQRGTTARRQAIRTTVTEREVNAYLAFETAGRLPAGIVEPSVSILDRERVTGRAVVDLDQVRQQRNPTSLLDPVRYLHGRLMVKATGALHAKEGVATFELESADIAGVPIPKLLLQQIITYYSRSAVRPAGISLDDPVQLPAGIREIQVARGQAIVIQ